MNSGIILTIAGAAMATYLTRFPLMLLTGRSRVPQWLIGYMKFIAPSVLTALIVPAIFIKNGKLDISASNEYIFASLITAAVAYFSKNMLAAVISGVATVALLVYVI